MADQNSKNEIITNLHMENYFPKEIFTKIDGQPNPTIHNLTHIEKYFESAAKDNVDRCRTSLVKDWVNKNLPVEPTLNFKPPQKPNYNNFITYNIPVSDYTRDAYNRIEQLKKLQDAYSVLRQKLQEKRKASCRREASEAEAAALDTQRFIMSLKTEDKDKIATELLLQNAEDLGIQYKDLEALSGLPFSDALKSIIDTVSNMINTKFATNLKDRCESARRKAGAEYRDEMETIKSELLMYKTKSEKLESTISTLNSYAEQNKQNVEKIEELQKSLKESNNQVNELKDSLYNMAKANEELEKNEIRLEEALDELDRYKLESEKLESAIKDLEILNKQKHDNEELIKMLQDELDQFKSKSLQLNTKIENLENLNKENLKPLNNELAEAYRKLSDLETSYREIETKKTESDKKLQRSMEEAEKYKQHSQELEQLIMQLEQKIEEIKKETADQLQDLQTCLTDANCKIESLEGTILQLKQLNNELEGGENKVYELQVKLEESNATIEKLQTTITHLENVSNKYEDYDEKMDSLQKKLREYAEKITDLENNASELNYKDGTLKADLDKYQQRIAELEKIIKDYEENTNVQGNEETENLKLEITQLNTQVGDLQTQKIDLEQMLIQLTADLEEHKGYKKQVEELQIKIAEMENLNKLNEENMAKVNQLTLNPPTAIDLAESNVDLMLDEQLYNRKSSRKGKKKSSKDTSRSDRSTSRHSRKRHGDNKSTDLEGSDSNENILNDPSELISEQLNIVKQSTMQLTELGYDSLTNVGSYLSDYIFGGN